MWGTNSSQSPLCLARSERYCRDAAAKQYLHQLEKSCGCLVVVVVAMAANGCNVSSQGMNAPLYTILDLWVTKIADFSAFHEGYEYYFFHKIFVILSETPGVKQAHDIHTPCQTWHKYLIYKGFFYWIDKW